MWSYRPPGGTCLLFVVLPSTRFFFFVLIIKAGSEAVTNPSGTAGGHVKAKLGIGAAARQSQTPKGLLAAKAAVRDGVPLLSRQDWRDPQTAKRGVALQRGSHRPTQNCWQQRENKAGEWRCSEAVTDPHGTVCSKGSCEGRLHGGIGLARQRSSHRPTRDCRRTRESEAGGLALQRGSHRPTWDCRQQRKL